jgi:hypothetical protein
VEVGNQIDAIESARGRVVGVYYADTNGTPLSAEQTSAKMDGLGWDGGYRIKDETRELWNATSLRPGLPGIFVLKTADMTVVASEALGPLNLIEEAQQLNQ